MTQTMDARQAQLQAQMTVCLDSLRRQYAAEMIRTIEQIHQRPRLKGADPLPTLAGNSRVTVDDSGAMAMGMVTGVPGLSDIAGAVVDAGLELYGSRKATMARPQDEKKLSFREMRAIAEANARDMDRLAALTKKIDLVDVYIASGYSYAANRDGQLLPLENMDKVNERRMGPSESAAVPYAAFKPRAIGPRQAAA